MKIISLIVAFIAAVAMAAPVDPPAGLMDRGVTGTGRTKGNGGFRRDVVIERDLDGGDIAERGVTGTGRTKGNGGFKRDSFVERGLSEGNIASRGVTGTGRTKGNGGF